MAKARLNKNYSNMPYCAPGHEVTTCVSGLAARLKEQTDAHAQAVQDAQVLRDRLRDADALTQATLNEANVLRGRILR